MIQKQQLHKVDLRCPICGADKTSFEEPILAKCDLCGQDFEADAICGHNHFVCHLCRQKSAREKMITYCLESKQTNPYALVLELMKLPETAMHGPEHHLLLAAALLTALCNETGRDDLAALLEDANARSLPVPGGACGMWGICGAAIGAGIFSSILLESSPFAKSEWQSGGQLTAKCADAISAQGGPRCCKRDTFLALRKAGPYSNEHFGTHFNLPEHIICGFFPNNEECKGRACAFFPKPK